MSKRLEELARRKEALIERCAEERADLSLACDQIRSPLHMSVAIAAVSRMLKTYPLIAAGLSSLLVSGYGSKFSRSATDVAKLWRMAAPLVSWLTSKRKRK